MLQNHRITEMSREFLSSSRPKPAAQDCNLNISTNGDSTISVSNLIQPLPTITVNKYCVQMGSHRF